MRIPESRRQKYIEVAVFLFLAVVIVPLVAIIGIGGYGLGRWLSQLFGAG